jgi:predicted DNA-binding transcriptional regulator YafY
MPKKKSRPRGRPPKKQPAPKCTNNNARELLCRLHIIDRFMREQFDDPDPCRRYLSIAGLVEVLRIARSTLVKDIKTLQRTLNAPLQVIKERGGWGYLHKAFQLPNILISEGDLTILCASWGALERRRNGQWGERVRPVMEKLMTALNTDITFNFDAVAERIVFRNSGYHDAVDIQIFETVVSAVLGQREIKFTYRKPTLDGSAPVPEARHVQPRCIICADNAWYVVSNDPDRDGEQRTFALFRMSEVKDTGIPFTPTGPIDLEIAFEHSLGIHRGGKVAQVELHFKPAAAGFAREEFWHDTEKFTALPDGSLHLTMEVAMNPELERRIQKYGSKVEVMGPAVLRDRFIEYAQEQRAMYLA